MNRHPHWASFVVVLGMLVFWKTDAAAAADRFALVVGVNECPDFRFPDGTRPLALRGAESDATAVAEILVRQFAFPRDHVRLLKGAEATHDKLQAAFKASIGAVGRQDVFVFYFSGHGTQVPDRPPYDEPDGLDEALCPYDATADGGHLVLDDELGLWLDDMPARDVTVVLDCCHAGTGIKDADDDLAARYLPIPRPAAANARQDVQPWRDLRPATKTLGRQVTAFYACHPEQQAYERRLPQQAKPARSGQFTHYFLAGLSGGHADANGDGVITQQEAFDYAHRRLDETFNRLRTAPGDRQQPLLETDVPAAPLFGRR
jgi:uncharacterized caspase-like protein